MKKKIITVDISAKELKKKLDIKDGYTPVKGVDYFDGENGKDAIVNTENIALEVSKLTLEKIKPSIPTIEQIEQDIPKLGEPIRDSLELLEGSNRLDKKAILGLEDYDEISKLAREKGKKQTTVGGAGARQFTALTDVPNSYSGQAGKYPVVKATEDGLEFSTVSSSSALTYMFANIASDVSTYYQAVSLSSYVIGTLGDISTAGVSTTPTIIGKFVTNLGFPNVTVIPAGTITLHIDTKKVSGSNNYYVYAEIYKRNLAGTRTLLATSDNSTQTAVNTQINQTVTALLATNINQLSTDRLEIDWYGVMVSSTATIHCYFDDSTSARIEFPTTFVDPTNYVTINTDQNITGTKTFLKTGLGATTTDAINLKNTTPATSGNQQVSPAITRTGQGWKTDGGGGSQSVAFRDYVLPVQSSANPTAILKNQFSINGGTWTDAFWYDQTPGGQGFALYTSSGQSNGVPGTTRIMSLNNTGLNTWIDNNFSGTRKSSWGADSSGVMYADATGSNGLVVRIGGIAYHYLSNLGLLTTGYGAFSYGVNAGSTNANTSTLQSSGGTGLQPKRVTVNTTLDNTATRWIADATDNSYCNGTTTYSCSHWTNQTDCELRNSHGGCTWNAGNPCSAFDNEFNMGTCLATSPCSATTASCVGPTDETTCLAQDDTYGGSCVFNPESTGDCSVFNGSESTCSGTTGCSVSSSNSCPSQFDEGSCTGAGCSWNGSSCDGDNSACTGTYVISPASCSGTYYTGACTGTYGASCSGTASCANIVGSSNCSGEAGCSFVNRIELYLPDLTTCPSMDYWIINKTPAGDDVIIYPYSGQTVNDTTSLTLANYKDGVHIGAYNDVRSCTTLSEGGCTPSGCTPNYVNCSWDYGLSVCTGGGSCSSYFDDTSCNAATYYSSCTGTYVASRNWDVWSRT